MDNFDGINVGNQNLNEPIPFDDGLEDAGVSHAPLDLGSLGPAPAPTSSAPKPVTKPAPKPVAKPSRPIAIAAAKPVQKAPSIGRIQGVKTFFTKLHPGAINFLDEQITRWLSENPDVEIKLTNVTVGEVQAKKTEPNILVTVWY